MARHFAEWNLAAGLSLAYGAHSSRSNPNRLPVRDYCQAHCRTHSVRCKVVVRAPAHAASMRVPASFNRSVRQHFNFLAPTCGFEFVCEEAGGLPPVGFAVDVEVDVALNLTDGSARLQAPAARAP